MNLLFSCIGRRGYIVEHFREHLEPTDRIIGTSNTKWTSGFEACDLGVVLPDIVSPEYLPSLLDLCEEQNIQALLSFFDPDINFLSHHLDEFRAVGVLPIIPSSEVNDISFDKFHTSLFLKEHGFKAPKTFLDLESATEALENGILTFPVMVKPRRGFGSKNLFRARNFEELEVFFNYAPEMLIQESLAGQEHHLDIFVDLQGEVLAVVPKRKLAMRAGETDQAVTCNDSRLMNFGLRLGRTLGELGHVGPLDVDLFVTDDCITVLELNPRFGGGYPLSHLAGADFPRLVLKMIKGENIKPEVGNFRSDVYMMKEYSILGGILENFPDPIRDLRGNASNPKESE